MGLPDVVWARARHCEMGRVMVAPGARRSAAAIAPAEGLHGRPLPGLEPPKAPRGTGSDSDHRSPRASYHHCIHPPTHDGEIWCWRLKWIILN